MKFLLYVLSVVLLVAAWDKLVWPRYQAWAFTCRTIYDQ